MPIDEHELLDLRTQVENLEHESQLLREAIADTTILLGHDGGDATDLRDASMQLDRLLEGQDVDCGVDYEGLAREVEALVFLVRNATGFGHKQPSKVTEMLSRLRCVRG